MSDLNKLVEILNGDGRHQLRDLRLAGFSAQPNCSNLALMKMLAKRIAELEADISRRDAAAGEPAFYIAASDIDKLKRANVVEAAISKVMRFDEIPVYTTPPAPSAPNGWIKCSDRMPEQKQSNRYVALNLLLNERTVAQGGFDDGEFWIEGMVVNNVTRWMSLPAAPGVE